MAVVLLLDAELGKLLNCIELEKIAGFAVAKVGSVGSSAFWGHLIRSTMNGRFGEFVSNIAMPPNVCIRRELQTGARQCVPNATITQFH